MLGRLAVCFVRLKQHVSTYAGRRSQVSNYIVHRMSVPEDCFQSDHDDAASQGLMYTIK